MFWPSIDVARRVSWSGNEVWAGGPGYGDLLIALRPALRALFLQGYQTNSIAIGIGSTGAGPAQWDVIDLESFELTKIPARYPSVTSALDVVFETTAMNDRRGVAAPEGYGMTGATMRIGVNGTLGTNGTIPQAVTLSIDAFVDAAVARLAPLVRNGTVPRGNHQGLLWIFDPAQFGNLPQEALDVVRLAFQNFDTDSERAIREQVTDRRIEANPGSDRDSPPNLRWMTIAVVYIDPFWHGLRAALEDRGESHRLTIDTQARLSGDNADSWLDVIVELLRLGVLDMDALIEAVEPVEPLVAVRMPATDQMPESMALRIWGERTILLFRVTPTVNPAAEGRIMTGIDGCIAWEYVPNPGDRPRVVIVAGRGISIAAPWYSESFPWFLDIYRVQDDALVPPVGATIDTGALLGAAIIDPQPGELSAGPHSNTRVVARGKKDGVFFEYPMSTTGQARFMLELTLTDPRSGTDGYIVDVHYYDYRPAENLPFATGVHFCVWATEGVTIESNGTDYEQNQAAATTHFASQWIASAEFWEFIDLQRVVYPFSDVLPITPRLAWNDDRIAASVPRFPDTQTVQHAIPHGGSGDVFLELVPKYYTPKTYDDHWAYLVADVVVGLIPVVGDLADAAELTIAWTTGRDRWGRPVSGYELALMTVATAVPFISSGFATGVARGLAGAAGEVFRGDELVEFFRRYPPQLGAPPGQADVETLASASHTYLTGARWGAGARQDATNALLLFLKTSPGIVEAFAQRMASATRDVWFTLDDIYDAGSDGFRIAAIQVPYRRWQRETGGGRDPHAFLASLSESNRSRGTAKIVAEALLGMEAVSRGARYVPQTGRFPSMRPEIAGPNHLLDEIDFSPNPPPTATMNFHRAVEEFVDAALAPASAVRVVDSGALRAARDVVEEADRAFLADATRALVESVPASRLPEVVGNDRIGGWNLTLLERAARFGTALLVACAEMRGKLLDPAWLLTPELLGELRVFVRDFISRKGAEIGMRFELSKAGTYYHELARHPNVEAIRTQLRMPLAGGIGTYVKQGPDIVLYLRDPVNNLRRAVFVQLKAYTDLSRLARGAVRIQRDPVTNLISGVRGQDFLEQAVSDALRVAHPDWEGSVPGPGELEDVPGDVVDWVRTANVHVLQFDDVLIRDLVFQLAMEARTRTGQQTIRAADIEAPNECVRDVFAQMFPNGLTGGTADEIFDRVHRESLWLDQWALSVEQWINTWMATNFDSQYGATVRFIVRRGNVDANDIVRDVLAMMPGLE